MNARWSKLQSLVKRIVSADLDFQIHCNVYRMKSLYGTTGLPRYWITLGKEIIWDYPAHFVQQGTIAPAAYPYPYGNYVSEIYDLIREYVDTPREDLLTKHFAEDKWGLIDVLRAADRRVGMRTLRAMAGAAANPAVLKVLDRRLTAARDGTG